MAKEIKIPIDTWDYPEISCVVSWYGILDSESWKSSKEGWLSKGLDIVFKMYTKDNVFSNHVTLCDLEQDVIQYPPSLFIAGDYDPLGLAESAETAHKMMLKKKMKSKLSIYNATHGFVGYPIQMQQSLAGGDPSHWKENCLAATLLVL